MRGTSRSWTTALSPSSQKGDWTLGYCEEMAYSSQEGSCPLFGTGPLGCCEEKGRTARKKGPVPFSGPLPGARRAERHLSERTENRDDDDFQERPCHGPRQSQPGPGKGRLRILIIEDERDLTDLLVTTCNAKATSRSWHTTARKVCARPRRPPGSYHPRPDAADPERSGGLPRIAGRRAARATSPSSSSLPRPRRPTRSSVFRSAPTITFPNRSASRCCCTASRPSSGVWKPASTRRTG